MKRIGLVVHGGRRDAPEWAERASRCLAAAGMTVYAEDEAAALLPGTIPFSKAGEEHPEAIVSLGGDGTLLRGVQWAAHWDAALLGINLGRVGFLTETEPDDLTDALTRLMEERYDLEERSLLEAVTEDGSRYLALNDVVVSRGGWARLIALDVLVDGESVGQYVADGLIVSTPTGSTGYSLSAGGPIVSPKVDCMLITPICAHTLQHRPCVVPGSADIRLKMTCDEETGVALQVDGQNCAPLPPNAVVDVHVARSRIRLIRLKPARFFQLVRDKLTEWSR